MRTRTGHIEEFTLEAESGRGGRGLDARRGFGGQHGHGV